MMDETPEKLESLVLGLFFGAAPPLFCFITTVIVTAVAFDIKALGPWALTGLAPGAIIDVLFLRKWVRNAYRLNKYLLGAFYVFYSVAVLAVCMGIPILNLALGVLAGAYTARKVQIARADPQQRNEHFERAAGFTAAVMVGMCCLITVWALAGGMIGSQAQIPFFSFTFTPLVFWAFVFTAAAILLLLQYWLTHKVARLAYRVFSATHPS